MSPAVALGWVLAASLAVLSACALYRALRDTGRPSVPCCSDCWRELKWVMPGWTRVVCDHPRDCDTCGAPTRLGVWL